MLSSRRLGPAAVRGSSRWLGGSSGSGRRGIHVVRVGAEPGSPLVRYRAGLYIDGAFPLKVSALDVRQYFLQWSAAGAMRRRVAGLLPAELPHEAAVSEIAPYPRDGGGVVQFTFLAADDRDSARAAAEGVVGAVNAHVAQRRSSKRWWWWWRPWLAPVRALAVRGTPFAEDIVRMLPSRRVRVEFSGPDLCVEQLFGELRPFGRILDIALQPAASKDQPRWAVVHFTRLRGATSARNCVHGDVVGATKLALSYVKEDAEHVVVQWLREHTKFSIPLAAAALIAAIYAVFDPIREFCVENRITGRFDVSRIPLLGGVRRAALSRLLWRREPARGDEAEAWAGLAGHGERLRSILDDPPESFTVVVGPHGSGKTRIVERATAGKRFRIVVDAGRLAAQPSEVAQMTQLARQVGWWPVFSSIISITNAIDLMVTATTGGNAGISATPESQVRRILETLALVLTNIRRRSAEAAGAEAAGGRGHGRGRSRGARFDVPAGAAPPDEVPVIVLDNLMDKELAFTPAILEWAAGVVEAGLAHCVITTSSIGGYHEVQRAQPQTAASLLSLDDASPMEAATLLQRQLSSEDGPGGSDGSSDGSDGSTGIAQAVRVLGGRREDLMLLVQKVRAGETMAAALESITQRAITEVRKHAFSDDAEVGRAQHTWTPEQFWFLLTELARHGDAEYDRVRTSPLFAGNDSALLGLAEAELITMAYDHDRPARIRPGRPVYHAAFARILADPGFSSAMAVRMNKRLIELETAKIRSAEEELALLNVFRASAGAHAALTGAMGAVAAAAGRSGAAAATGRLQPEAFIAQAAGASGFDGAANIGSAPRPWLGWLFGWRARPAAAAAADAGANGAPAAQRPAVPGVPHELQGRVRFLLRAIHASQLKIDEWDAECRAKTQCLASL
ncbi:mitochondrial escape protein 2 [Coemansia javaensis]|uniref:Mitochondrial escape protein 2 n=1 Tax=Coemansia javaensis TaxID=2761396 RepID=A0A9W8H5M9_9FUNG|nr:mitochondrial escape protein 2 [Coemansia javaensis]